MNNPGPLLFTYNGGAFPIVAPGVFLGDWIAGLSGMLAASLQAQLLYGAGGASVTIYFQTALDQGQTPIDVAAMQFGTAGGTLIANLSALDKVTPPIAPQQQALTPGTCVDGMLGDRLRAVVVVSGTYGGGTLLNLTGCAR